MLKLNKKNILLIVFLFFVGFVVVPFFINCMFKISLQNDFLAAEWSAGDALAFYGSILSFISTTILGIVAIKQSVYIGQRDLFDRNKINIYLDNNSLVEINYDTDTDEPTYYEFRFSINNVLSAFPEHAILTTLTLYNSNNHKEIINCIRKSMCGITAKSNSQFEMSVYLHDCTYNLSKDMIDIELVKYYQRGFATYDEIVRNSRIVLNFDIGFYNGKVITPINIYMTIQPDEEYISNMTTDKRIYTYLKYKITETRCIIRTAILEDEYEKKLS